VTEYVNLYYVNLGLTFKPS